MRYLPMFALTMTRDEIRMAAIGEMRCEQLASVVRK